MLAAGSVRGDCRLGEGEKQVLHYRVFSRTISSRSRRKSSARKGERRRRRRRLLPESPDLFASCRARRERELLARRTITRERGRPEVSRNATCSWWGDQFPRSRIYVRCVHRGNRVFASSTASCASAREENRARPTSGDSRVPQTTTRARDLSIIADSSEDPADPGTGQLARGEGTRMLQDLERTSRMGARVRC